MTFSKTGSLALLVMPSQNVLFVLCLPCKLLLPILARARRHQMPFNCDFQDLTLLQDISRYNTVVQ